MTTIRTFLAVAVAKGWDIQQLDINNAFLHGDLDEESTADPSLFTKASDTSFMALLIYVDDILVAGTDSSQIDRLKQFLDKTFKIKDLGHLNYFLGIEAFRSTNGLNICQRKYTLEILKEYGFMDAKPAKTPITAGQKLSSLEGTPLDKPEVYRTLVGKLLYLTNTRPEITYAVQQLSQYVDKPRNTHLMAAHRVLRYLKGSPRKGMFYPANSQIKLQGFSDSDWATCAETRKSVTGYSIYLGKSLISWKTKKQATVSRSSSEAEYRALASTVCEVQWLLYLLADLKVKPNSPATLFCDNKSAIAIGENHVFHEITKHIEIDCHVVKQKVYEGIIKLMSVPSQKQLADGFTKALPILLVPSIHGRVTQNLFTSLIEKWTQFCLKDLIFGKEFAMPNPIMLEGVRRSDGVNDNIFWSPESNGRFSVSSACGELECDLETEGPQ
ncbi:PREDICTED: uncharacterized protein LOC109166974 [Ipomoea nil]|uniref:uncharacterized protein LOC109166974 n=1 Tax=Ipomoea nil TaxID=35883 RepID=UPI000900A55F|nr:PREDICTED: uncharacterized protein LOC109166974 [Ipomoea nil]